MSQDTSRSEHFLLSLLNSPKMESCIIPENQIPDKDVGGQSPCPRGVAMYKDEK